MANEIKVFAQLQASNGNFSFATPSGVRQYDQTTARGGTPGVISITTTTESIAFGDVTPGFVWIRNLSTGDSALLKVSTGGTGINWGRLKPGWVAIIPKSTDTTWQVAASTAGGTPDLDIRSLST